MKREEVTEKIIAAKMAKDLEWADIADRVGRFNLNSAVDWWRPGSVPALYNRR